jgi:hypothetical protein
MNLPMSKIDWNKLTWTIYITGRVMQRLSFEHTCYLHSYLQTYIQLFIRNFNFTCQIMKWTQYKFHNFINRLTLLKSYSIATEIMLARLWVTPQQNKNWSMNLYCYHRDKCVIRLNLWVSLSSRQGIQRMLTLCVLN